MLRRHPILRLQLSGGHALACAKLARLLPHTLRFEVLLLVGQLRLHVLPSAKLLDTKVGCKVLLPRSESGLLVGQSRLHCLLGIHAHGLVLRGLVLHVSLLLTGQVGQRCLQSNLACAKLLRTNLRSKVLLPHGEACLLVGLLRRKACLLLCVELSLCLLKCGLQTCGLDVTLLLRQITGSFGLHDGLAATAKRTRLNRRSAALSTSNVCLTLCFALLYAHNTLHVRRHVRIGRAGLCKRLCFYALCGPHLKCLQLGVVAGLGSAHRSCIVALRTNVGRSLHLVVLEVLRLHAIRTKLP